MELDFLEKLLLPHVNYSKDTLVKKLNDEILYPVHDSRLWKPHPIQRHIHVKATWGSVSPRDYQVH